MDTFKQDFEHTLNDTFSTYIQCTWYFCLNNRTCGPSVTEWLSQYPVNPFRALGRRRVRLSMTPFHSLCRIPWCNTQVMSIYFRLSSPFVNGGLCIFCQVKKSDACLQLSKIINKSNVFTCLHGSLVTVLV